MLDPSSALGLLALTALLISPPLAETGDVDDREQAAQAQSFGFSGFELYEVGDGTFDLVDGDLNGDGRSDLGVVHNARSRIELLLRRDAASDTGAGALDDGANPIAYDKRYEVRRLTVERRIRALAFLDIDGDGRDEVAYATQGGFIHIVGLADSAGAKRFELERKYDELAARYRRARRRRCR